MKKITILNTAILSNNIGDYIIMDSVSEVLNDLFKNDMFFDSYTHGKVSKESYFLNKQSDYSFIGGTNLLSSNMNKYNQWKINLIDGLFLKNIILMGVGWWQYQDKPNYYTKYLLKKVLSEKVLHSVRDSYSEKMLKSIGVNNVINTGCMTMWGLTKEHCLKIPNVKADDVVFTLTDYNKDYDKDQILIDILKCNYKTLYFWPQGLGDLEYLKSLKNIKDVNILGGNLHSYNALLENENINLDFIGTRLHAGIRALQNKRRTIIIGIDNRAEEKRKDFNLNVVDRENINEISNILNHSAATEIKINEVNIEKWKNQFR